MNLRSSRPTLTSSEANAFVQLIGDMGAAQDRMHYVAPGPRVAPEPCVRYGSFAAISSTPRGGDTSDFTPHERALFRALAQKFPPDKCVEMVLRARKAGAQC
jgi:hypothetical protein